MRKTVKQFCSKERTTKHILFIQKLIADLFWNISKYTNRINKMRNEIYLSRRRTSTDTHLLRDGRDKIYK